MQRIYLAIDLKSYYASAECAARHLDPLTTNLVVADSSRTEKTICLAVSPSLKAYGISGRARLFEVMQKVKEVNANRLREAWIEVFKEQVLLLLLDEYGEAITRVTVIGSPGGAEVAHYFDGEGTAIRPCDRCRLHKTGWVEGRIDLHIDALSLCSMLNCHCIGHPSYYKCPASSEIVPRKLRLGISGRCK